MITQPVEKRSMYLNNLLKSTFIFFSFFFITQINFAQQQQKKKAFQFQKFGIQITHVSQERWFVDDPDYSMTGLTVKPQWHYHMRKLGSWDFNLLLQPQFQSLQHQLDNIFFVDPSEYPTDFLELRNRWSQKRTMSFFAFELGFQLRKSLVKDLHFEFTAGLGAGYIDSETERLALGFTFVENLSFGFSKTLKTSEIYLGFNLNHISNLDIQLPNSGYDLLGFELGYRFIK